MKNLLLILSISISGICLNAQSNLDSLYAIWQDETVSDTIRVDAYKNYIWNGFMFSNSDTAFILAQNLLDFGDEHFYAGAKINAYYLMGISNYLKSDYTKALDYYQRSLKIQEEIGDKKASASTINNIGIIYKQQGDYPKALEYYQRSLKINEEIGDKKGSALTINNIGIIYKQQGDFPKALEYYQRSLKINEEIGDKKGIAYAIGNIGFVCKIQGNYPKALEYCKKALTISQEIGDKKASASNIHNIGLIYHDQGDFPKALEYYQRSLKMEEEIGDKKGIASTINNIGIIYKQQGDYPKALKYCNKGLKISQEIGALVKEKQACKCLYEIYKVQGNANEALVYIEKLNIIEDSLNIQETTKKLQQMEFQKQVLEDSLAREKVILLEKQKEEEIIQAKKRQNQIQYSLMVMFVLFLAALIAAMTKFSYKPRMAAALIFIFFILIFEFLLVLLSPWVDTITNGEVGFKIMLNTLMAILIFGLHQISEKRIKKILIK